MQGGTMLNDVNSPRCNTFNIRGGLLSQPGNLVFGTPIRPVVVQINTSRPRFPNNAVRPSFAGTSKDITIYANTALSRPMFGITNDGYGPLDAGTYTGFIRIIPTNTGGTPSATVYGGTYRTSAVVPVINTTGGTGKTIDTSLLATNYGFAVYSGNNYISGSSDILQSSIQ
jgi:hypothetical protein